MEMMLRHIFSIFFNFRSVVNKNFNIKNYTNNLILSLFIVQNKLTLIFIVLINLVNINKIKLMI